jgi:hypothetical protein
VPRAVRHRRAGARSCARSPRERAKTAPKWAGPAGELRGSATAALLLDMGRLPMALRRDIEDEVGGGAQREGPRRPSRRGDVTWLPSAWRVTAGLLVLAVMLVVAHMRASEGRLQGLGGAELLESGGIESADSGDREPPTWSQYKPDGGPAASSVVPAREPLVAADSTVHVTHLFNSFAPRTRALSAELTMVRLSWERATRFAASRGLVVEHLDAVLANDVASVPAFARSVVITEVVIDPYNKRELPTVGEIFRAGKERGRGELLIYTNLDIGVHENFYVEMWAKAHARLEYDPAEQRALFARSSAALAYCLDYQGDSMNSAELCVADADEYERLHGAGAPALRTHFRRHAARLYAQNKTAGARGPGADEKARAYFVSAGGAASDLEAAMALEGAFAPLAPPGSSGSGSRPAGLVEAAFTVTRMDLAVNAKELSELEQPSLAVLDKLLTGAKAQPHPGNDCFAMPRARVPETLMRSRHPLSWRPWGFWVRHTFEWDEGLEWRRYEGTRQWNLTFHMGVSGKVADDWLRLRNLRPVFTLTLAAEWDALAGGRAGKLYEVPKYCDHPWLYRQAPYCQGGPGLDAMALCAGNVRYGCSMYNYPRLRDGYNYMLGCDALLRRAKRDPKRFFFVEPYCSFCKPLFKVFAGPQLPASREREAEDRCDRGKRMLDCTPKGCTFAPR